MNNSTPSSDERDGAGRDAPALGAHPRMAARPTWLVRARPPQGADDAPPVRSTLKRKGSSDSATVHAPGQSHGPMAVDGSDLDIADSTLLVQAAALLAQARPSDPLRDMLLQLMDWAVLLERNAEHETHHRRRLESHNRLLMQAAAQTLLRERRLLHDLLADVTDGRLILCVNARELPAYRKSIFGPVRLSRDSGLRELRKAIKAPSIERGIDIARWHDFEIAVGEAAMNAVVHAGGGEGSVRADAAGPIQVWISDTGRGIDVANLPQAALRKGYTTAGSLGQGMKMILQTVDRMFLLTGPGGTTVVLEQDPIASLPPWG